MFSPSQRTSAVWTAPYYRHAFRIEVFLFIVNILAIIFSIAASVLYARHRPRRYSSYYYSNGGYDDDYYGDADYEYYGWERTANYASSLVPPLVTLVVTILDLGLYLKVCLHPIYTLVLSLFWTAGWIISFIFILGVHFSGNRSTALVGIEATQEALFGVMFCGYFAYFIISCVGVDHFRVSNRVAAAMQTNAATSSQALQPGQTVQTSQAPPQIAQPIPNEQNHQQV